MKKGIAMGLLGGFACLMGELFGLGHFFTSFLTAGAVVAGWYLIPYID